MKLHMALGMLALMAAPVLAAEKEDVAIAAKQLADKENYSWRQTTEVPEGSGGNRFRPGPVEGKTEKGGYTTLSYTVGDNTVEAVVKGEKGAIKTEDGWQSLEEAAQEGQQGRGRFFARMLRNQRTPAQQAADLASKTKELKKADDAIAGDLTEEGAKELLRFRRRGGDDANAPEISGAKGSVKFWIKDGALVKYQYHVQGTVRFNDQDREVDRTTTVEIKDVGKTKVEVPAEAKTKAS
jgi:hypothetical protein